MKIFYCSGWLVLLLGILLNTQTINAQQIALVSPQNMAQYTVSETVLFETEIAGVTYPEPAYMLVKNSLTGYRKLKFGYDPVSLYSPLQNVTAGGNTHLEITMKLVSGVVDWTKILIRPMGLGSLSLQPYIASTGGISNEWKVVTIPLTDFIPTINFSQIANIEFPYSSNAAPFEMAIASIKFIGGTSLFTWFGDGHINNKHNGNGGPGELTANVVPALFPAVFPQMVEFFDGESKLGEDLNPPYTLLWSNPLEGTHTVKARLIMSNQEFFTSPEHQITILPEPVPVFSVALKSPIPGDTVAPQSSFDIVASVSGLYPPPPDHLLVTNSLTGYRKLKLGYSPVSLYTPLMDVVSGGNTALEITMRDVAGSADWGKIQIRPAGMGTLCLQPYVNAAGGIGEDWKTITIPLSDFTGTINFGAIANLEFPYSASAANFQIAVKSIRFTGGTSPFVWFGNGKTNNLHNGNGGSGELVASLVLGSNSGDYLEKVEFFSGENKLGESYDAPYTLTIPGFPEGIYQLTATVTSHTGFVATSPTVDLAVYNPPVPPSTMSVSIVSPVANSSWLAPLNLPIDLSFAGNIVPGPDFLRVNNSLTGFVKLKLGYSPSSIYTPKQNVISGGNDTLELVLKNSGGAIDWSKIRIRPSGIGLVNLGSYCTMAGGIGNEWKTIKIPLSAFDATIDFSALAYLEFPYSAGANTFQIDVLQIRFTGGTIPFTWFGNGKTNNAHDGDGTSGHMTAGVISTGSLSLEAAQVRLYDNGVVVDEDLQPPFNLTLPNPEPGSHALYVRMTDSWNSTAFSDTINVSVISEVPEGNLLVTVTFDQPPSEISVKKAPLRYDKDFAYSFSLDDGLIDAYTSAFPLFGGGYSPATFTSYPGLFYTDGCGNDLPFRASLMWNSVSSSYVDIHLNTPGYVTWTQLGELLDSGWNVVNHSYSHANGDGTNYPWQITANDSAIFSHTGRHVNHFVAPSGDAGYYPVAFQMGNVCSYSRTTTNGSPYGLKVDDPLNYNQFMVYRDFKSDDIVTPETVAFALDNCAALSQGGNHYWYNDFTHHVAPSAIGGSLLFSTFHSYMEYAASIYGKTGSDRMWMASGTEVFEYLRLRDACPLSWSLFGNQLRVLINRDNIPDGLQKYAMSIVIDADASITDVELNEPAEMVYRGNTPRKLINLEWQTSVVQSLKPVIGTGSGEGTFSQSSAEKVQLNQIGHSEVMMLSLAGSTVDGQITVINFEGNQVRSFNYKGASPDGKFKVALSGLAPGFYLIRYVGSDGTSTTGKFYYPQCR